MPFIQHLVVCLTVGLLSPTMAKPVTVDVSITVDGDAVTTSSSTGTTSKQWPSNPTFCQGTNFTVALLATYVCGDSRLGPIQLPMEAPPLDTVVDSYDQLGGYTPGDFIQEFWNETGGRTGTGGWIYPPESGFSIDAITGGPILGTLELQNGTLVDRFGSDTGKYIAPVSAPYQQRSLPPDNLDTPSTDPK